MAVDLSAFSSNSFGTRSWINQTLLDKPDDEPLEAYLASIAMKLHIISQDYTDQLETGMVESMTIMPRVLSDVARIEEVLKSLETEMQNLAAQLKSFDTRNVAGVEDLSRLDTLKSNMEKCKATLEEHARWSQVVREAKTILESGGRLADSADRIETMHRSLDILQNLPGHDERKDMCESLSDALLAALRPRVRRDIISLDLSPLHEYLYVYEKLSRKQELEEEYVRARPERLKGIWDKYSPDASPEQFAPWLAVFLGKVASLLAEESSNSESLFGRDRSPDVLCMLLQHSLKPLSDPMINTLTVATSPVLVAELYTVTDEFAKRIVPFLDGCAATNIYAALSTVFGGFLALADTFGEKEGVFLKTTLVDLLDVISFDSVLGTGAEHSSDAAGEDDYLEVGGDTKGGGLKGRGASQDPVEAFEAFGDRLVAAAEAAYEPTHRAIGRAVSVMGGSKAKVTLRAAATAVATFTKALTVKIDYLRITAGFPSAEGAGTAGVVSATAAIDDVSGGSGSTKASQLADSWARRLQENDIRGRELVPGALRALQAAGRLSRTLRELESEVVEALTELSASVFKDVAIDRAVALITSHHQLQQAACTAAGAAGAAAPAGGIAGMSVGAIFTNCWLQADLGAASELRAFLTASASHHASQTAFAPVNAPLARLKSTAGALLFDLCTAAPEKMLADLHAEDVWVQGSREPSTSKGGDASMELGLTDNLLPLPAVTQVGEHLLSLVQELETFASSDALPDLLCLTGDTQTLELAARGWRRLRVLLDDAKDVTAAPALVREADYEGVDQLCRRSTCAAAVVVAEKALFGMQLSRVVEDAVGAGADDSESDADAAALSFVNEWLGAVADCTVGLVVAQWLQVTMLSPAGRAQLVVDLEYISNVVQAMGLRQHPLLVHMRQLLLKEPQSLTVGTVDTPPARSPVALALHRFDAKLSRALAIGHGLAS